MRIPYPISHIPEISNSSENRHSAAKRGCKKVEWELVGDAAIILFFFYRLFKSFNWRIIDLQCCGGFCRTTFISRVCPRIPFLWSLPPTSQPSRSSQSAGLSALCYRATSYYFTHSLAYTGGGHGNPLPYSPLGNPMDGGAGRTTVHGVARSWTRVSD